MSKRRQVYKFTDLAELRFKPQSLSKPAAAAKFQEVKGWTSKLVQMVKQKVFRSPAESTETASSKLAKKPVVDLTLTAYLNTELLLVGNSSKLDLIQIEINKQEEEMEIRLLTEIFPAYPVKTITIERKKQFVLFSGDYNIELYVLDSKSHSLVKKFFYTSTKQIKGVQFIGDNCLLEYHDTFVNILGLQSWQPQIIQTINYDAPPTFKVYVIPPCSQNYGNIFLYDEQQQIAESKKKYPLVTMYTCQITYENSEFTLTKLQKFFQMQKQSMQNLIIYNYDIHTVLFNFGYKMIVIKKHYPIDEITINHKDLNSKLFYLENKNIVHVCDTMIESYSLEVSSNHVNVRCFDCINFKKPTNSLFLSIISLQDDKFILLFKLNNKSNIRQTRYWITTTIQTSIKTKLEYIFKRSRNNNEEIFESAVKMGMARNEIFNELWMQSTRRTKADFDILIQSEDYKVITDGVRNVLKKESISFKELVRIEKECFKILEKQIKRNPTETNIVHYLKCSFTLRKYRVQKRLQTEKKKRMNVEQQPSNPVQIQLSIQQYQDIRKRNIKNYMLDLMKKCDQDSISIIKHMIDIFRMTFRHIFPSFMREIIGELKSGLFTLLQAYPQLLPLPKNQNSSNSYGPLTHGVWADFLMEEWEDNIYFENLQNIDNIKILENLMTKDYFKWDWLVEHDFFKIKRAEFENQFRENREKGIFYIFFSELFEKVTDQDSLTEIIQEIERKYQIPEHLAGKTRLYWEIHQFFQTAIPDYNLTFQTFLSLKQDEIYRIIFTKNKKALVLKQIKTIYNSVCDPEVYDESILCYFRADYSSLADLKYLLNRVNSEKREFHDRNQNLYKILVEAVHYKLRWQEGQTLPINEVIVYYENIPLKEQEISKLNKIQNLGYHMDILQKLELDINLREFFDNGVDILNKVAFYLVKVEAPEHHIEFETDKDSGEQSFSEMLNKMLLIRDNLFYENEIDDEKVLELFVFNFLDYDDYLKDVQRILKDDRLLRKFHRPNFQSFLEKIITEKVSQAFKVQASFKGHQKYINGMIELLDKNSVVRKQLYAHLQLGLLLSVLANPPQAPLMISIRFIENIVAKENIQTIKSLDYQKIYNYMLLMGIQEPITNLYEVLIIKYLAEGQWNQAIKFTKLWNDHHNSISFSATVMLRLAEELPRDLRPVLVDIVIMKLNDPEGILQLAQTIINNIDGKERRKLIESEIKKGDFETQENYENNYLAVLEFREMTYPSNSEYVKNLFDDLMKSDAELQNNYIYYMYYRILMCNPLKAAEFHIKNFDFLDIRVLKTMICELSKKLYKQSGQYLFDRQELYLFMYKCLIVSYSSNFLSKQFVLETLLRFGLEDIEARYGSLLEELKKAMISFGEKEKISILRFFKKLYYKSIDNLSVNPFELSSEEEQNTVKNPKTISNNSSNRVLPLKTKKSLYQMLPVEQDRSIGTFNNIITPSIRDTNNHNLKLVSKSVRSSYKPPSEEDIADIPKLKTENKSVMDRKKVMELSPGMRGSEEDIAVNLLNSENEDEEVEENTKRELRYQNGENKLGVGYQGEGGYKKSVSIEEPSKEESREKEVDVLAEPEVEPEPETRRRRTKIIQPVEQPAQQLDTNIQRPPSPPAPDATNQNNAFLQRSRLAQSISQSSQKQPSQDWKNPTLHNPHSDPNCSNQKDFQFGVGSPHESHNIVKVNRDKRYSNFSEAVRFSSEFPTTTERDLPQEEQSRLEASELSSLYQGQEHNGEQNVFTINIKEEDKIIDSEKVDLGGQQHYLDEHIITSLIEGDYAPLMEQIQAHPASQLSIIKSAVSSLYPLIPFQSFVPLVQKLRETSIQYHTAVKVQNFKVLKNALKVPVSFDVRKIFAPEILYITTPDNNVDELNKLIFRYLKPKIINTVEQENVFTIAKILFLALNFNKSFEWRVQYYYLEKLLREVVEKETDEERKMDLEKIEMLLSKLPIGMTMERMGKMLGGIVGGEGEVGEAVLRSFLKVVREKRGSLEGEKYEKEIAVCEDEIARRLGELENR